MFKVAKASIPFQISRKGGSASDHAPTFYSEEDFSRTAAGTRNIKMFICHMRPDFLKHYGPLENKDGFVMLKSGVKVTWDELLSRAGSYFRKFTKSHEYFKKNHSSKIKWLKRLIIQLMLQVPCRPLMAWSKRRDLTSKQRFRAQLNQTWSDLRDEHLSDALDQTWSNLRDTRTGGNGVGVRGNSRKI